MVRLKRHIDFIKESDNLERSIKAMDKFGITDFRRLPIELEESLKKNGFIKPEDHFVIDTTDESVHQKELDNGNEYIHISIANSTTEAGIGKDGDIGIYISADKSDIINEIYINGHIKRKDYKKLLPFVDNIDEIFLDIIDIAGYDDKSLRKQDFSNIFKKYGISDDYVDPGSKINESNDNFKKSADVLKRFGMNPYNSLPMNLSRLAVENGFKKIPKQEQYWEGMTEESVYGFIYHNNNEDIHIDMIVYVNVEGEDSKDADEKSTIGFLVDYEANSFEITRGKEDVEDIEKFIRNRQLIFDEIVKYLKNPKQYGTGIQAIKNQKKSSDDFVYGLFDKVGVQKRGIDNV
jgi:hypothetical protein